MKGAIDSRFDGGSGATAGAGHGGSARIRPGMRWSGELRV